MAGKKEKIDSISIITNQIKTGDFSHAYLLYGDQRYLVMQYKDELIKALVSPDDGMNLTVFKGDSINADAIAADATTLPFFADRRVTVVEDSGYFKKSNDTINELIQNMPESNYIIFIEQETDGKVKTMNSMKKFGQMLPFDTPSEGQLVKWMSRKIKERNIEVSDDTLHHLIGSVGNDMNLLSNEVEKLSAYATDKGVITDEDISLLCAREAEDKVFELMDALATGNKKSAMDKYLDLQELGSDSVAILRLIKRQYAILMRTKVYEKENLAPADFAKLTGAPIFFLKKYVAMSKSYNYKQLFEIVDKCQTIEADLFSGKIKSIDTAVSTLILELLTK